MKSLTLDSSGNRWNSYMLKYPESSTAIWLNEIKKICEIEKKRKCERAFITGRKRKSRFSPAIVCDPSRNE